MKLSIEGGTLDFSKMTDALKSGVFILEYKSGRRDEFRIESARFSESANLCRRLELVLRGPAPIQEGPNWDFPIAQEVLAGPKPKKTVGRPRKVK